MITNEQLIAMLEKANITTSLGGQQSAQDVQKFVDLATDQTAVLKAIRSETGIVTSRNVDAIDLGDPAMVAATEVTAPDSADVVAPTINRKTLSPTEVLLAYNISFDFLRKNIEGNNVNATLNKLFAKRYGKDVVIAAFNGDDSITDTTRLAKCKKILNGFIVQAQADPAVHDVSVSGADYLTTIFPNLLDALPKDYKDDREALGLFVSPDVAEAYAQQIGDRNTAYGDTVLTNNALPRFRGIQLIPVYQMSDTKMILTPKSNLCIGFGQNMTVGMDIYNRRRVIEYTIIASLDAKEIVGDALVLGSD